MSEGTVDILAGLRHRVSGVTEWQAHFKLLSYFQNTAESVEEQDGRCVALL
jgi:hypothetical protein